MSAMTVTFIIYSIFIFIYGVHSFSACDEVDITFVIDTDSITANSDAIIKFITSIIWSGSSEHTAFSAVVYGNTIPIEQNIKIISLHDTHSTIIRQVEARQMKAKLGTAFYNYKHSNSDTKHVDLGSAFKIATGQSQPHHKGNKKQKLGFDKNDHSIGVHDGRQIYFIFDHKNKLLHNANEIDICELFYHLDNTAIKNDDVAVYFMMGHLNQNDRQHIMNILCNGYKSPHIKYNTFHRFSSQFAYNDQAMETIYQLTCPAEIKSSAFAIGSSPGIINVGNHVQFIDIHTIINCELFYWDHDKNQATPDELDRHRSYIKIKDYVNDDNTFKVYDYLVAGGDATYTKIQTLGCRDAVYKITQIQHLDPTQYGTSAKDYHKIITVFVRLPDTPMEYIAEAQIKGNVPMHTLHNHNTHQAKDKEKTETSGRRILRQRQYDEEYTGNQILQHKIRKLKNIAKRAVDARKTVLRLLSKWRKHRHVNGGIFGAKIMEQQFLGHVGRFFKNTGRNIQQTVKQLQKTVRTVMKGQLGSTQNMKLINLNFKKDWRYMRTKTVSKTFGSSKPNGFKVLVSGDGNISLKFGFWFQLQVGIYFNFYWRIFADNVHIEFKIYGEWDISAYFNAKFIGQVSALFDKMINSGKKKVFFIGPIPVMIRPYIIIFAEIVTLPQQVYAGIKCEYSERIEIGYIYDNKIGRNGPIKTRKLIKKECSKKFGVDEEKEGDNVGKCPIEKLGFDIKLSVKIGCSLYAITNVFLRMEFVIPFRISLPEMNPQMCKLSIATDMCRIGPYLKVGFRISMHMNIYFGASLDVGQIFKVLKKIMIKKKSGATFGAIIEKKSVGPIYIIPEKSLGCLDLKGGLKVLNQQFYPKCCAHLRPQFIIGHKPHPKEKKQNYLQPQQLHQLHQLHQQQYIRPNAPYRRFENRYPQQPPQYTTQYKPFRQFQPLQYIPNRYTTKYKPYRQFQPLQYIPNYLNRYSNYGHPFNRNQMNYQPPYYQPPYYQPPYYQPPNNYQHRRGF